MVSFKAKAPAKRITAIVLCFVIMFSMALTNVYAISTDATVSVSDITETEATLTITNNGATDAYPVVYYTVLEASSDVPTAEELKSDGTMTQDGSFTQGAATSTTVNLNELTAGTDYVAYAVIYYAKTASFSNVAIYNFTTEKPTETAFVTVSEVTKDGAKLTIVNNGATDAYPVVYYTVLEASSDVPTAEELKSDGTMTQDGSFTQGAATSTTVNLNELTAGTDYVAYAVIYYAKTASFSNVAIYNFTTEKPTETAFVTVSEVTKDGAKLTIINNGATDAYPVAYYTVFEASSDVPTAEELKSDGTMTQDGSFTQGAATSTTVNLNELTADTDYVAYAVIYYAKTASFGEVGSVAFTTTADSDNKPTAGTQMSLTYTDSDNKTTTEYYDDYNEAVAKVNALDAEYTDVKLTVLKDITLTVDTEWKYAIEINRTCTLDLNGYELYLKSKLYQAGAINIYGDITVTIIDSSENQTGTIKVKTNGGSAVAIAAQPGPYMVSEKCDVHFIMTGGNLISQDYTTGVDQYAVTIESFGEFTMNGGYINGGISANGIMNMNGGTIEAESPIGVVIVNNKFTMDGGTIKNTQSYASVNSANCAVQVRKSLSVVISGGVLHSDAGPALYVDGSYENTSPISITGTAKLSSNESSAMYLWTQFGFNINVDISGNAILDGETYSIQLYDADIEEKLKVNIADKSYFGYAENGIPFYPNSSFVSYSDGMVLDTKPVTTGDYAGYYTLAKTSDLKQMIGSIEWEYQYLDDLDETIVATTELYKTNNEAGIYDSTLWDAFASAYKAALPVLNNANANQNEIDCFNNELGTAYADMIAHAENAIDLSNLADGTYSVNIEMWNVGFRALSMANGAVESKATIVVEDGAAKLLVNFKPMNVSGLWGSMMQYWFYDADSFAEAKANGIKTEADYIAWQNVEMIGGTVTPIEGTPSESPSMDNTIRPKTISFTLPYIGSANDMNKIYSCIGVDAMRGSNVGDQNLILYIKYSTLKAEELQPTLKLDKEEVALIAGNSDFNKTTVTATLQNANGYDVSWSSDNEDVAIVSNGVITAISGGECSVICTATNGTYTLTKTVKVTVTGNTAGISPVKIESITASGTEAAATLIGSVLVSTPTDGVAVDGETVTVNATSDASGIKSAKVVIPADTAAALNGKTVIVNTNVGTVKMDAALVAQMAAVNQEVVLTIKQASNPNENLYTAAYELALSAGGETVDLGKGTAAVTVACDNSEVIYAYCLVDGKRTQRVPVAVSDNTASWNVSRSSVWALSSRDLTTPENGTENSDGFFLKDGIYYVDIDLWKALSDEQSMGAIAFANNNKALVTVENGKITKVQIASNPVDVGAYHSAIITFKVNGESVTVLETGDLITQPAGQAYKYIKRAEFTMPDQGQPVDSSEITYVDVQFWVPDTPMDAAVGDVLDARLKFIWSTAVSAKDENLDSNDKTASNSVDITLRDEATGIIINTSSDYLDENAEIYIEKITSGSNYDIAKKAMGNLENWELYKIVTLVDGVETSPTGTVKISIPCGTNGLTVYRINDDGTKTLLKGEVKDGYYYINTSKLGLFAFVGEQNAGNVNTQNQSNAIVQDNNSSTNTQAAVSGSGVGTGDNSNIQLYLLLLLASAGIFAFVFVINKRKSVRGE